MNYDERNATLLEDYQEFDQEVFVWLGYKWSQQSRTWGPISEC